jgi:peptidoglycan hydrolase-like protein with peptidoglycan-binding domain
MIRVTLRKQDGLGERAWLRSVVARAQAGLRDAGQKVNPDGKFGDATDDSVRQFQRAAGLPETGVVSRSTWTALDPHVDVALADQIRAMESQLPKFRGDLDWVHRQEAHKGHPYWPGGKSGVTLDPGVDLGQAPAGVIDQYRALTSTAQFDAIESAVGVTGDAARAALQASPTLQSIRLGREQAEALMPPSARPYWRDIGKRFTSLRQPTTLGSVQTALLSLAYNRGAFNTDLGPLEPLLAGKQWVEVAERIGAMQQQDPNSGLARRRREEAFIIRVELDYLAE